MAASLVGPGDSPGLADADQLDDRAPETASSVLLRPALAHAHAFPCLW
jgi:hypothetical protein